MKAGDSLPSQTHHVRPEAIAIMADLLHDPNPIHLDPAAAEAAGLGPRVINQGPANLGYILNMLSSAFPGFSVARIDSRYLANVRDGDAVTAGGEVVEFAGNRVECKTWLCLEDGQPAVSANVSLERR